MKTLQEQLQDAYLKDGAYYWTNCDRVVPPWIWTETGESVPKQQQQAYDAEVSAFLQAYRQNYQGPSAEERVEARAAFGAGVKLVNAITGREWTT